MIYAFVISHLLKQGVNAFVPLHQSRLQRQRGKDGASVLEEGGKVNQSRLSSLSALLLQSCFQLFSPLEELEPQ